MSEYQELAKECKCCSKHVPLPIVMKSYNGIVVCPTTLQSLSVLIDKLGKDKNKIKFYFVSIDPERDTPAVLKDYLSSFNPKINALTGKQKDLDVLIKSFSIYAKKVPLDNNNYTMDHSAALILIDKSTNFVGTITFDEKNRVALEKLQKLIKN